MRTREGGREGEVEEKRAWSLAAVAGTSPVCYDVGGREGGEVRMRGIIGGRRERKESGSEREVETERNRD